MAEVTDATQIRSLTQEFSHAMSVTKKGKQKLNSKKEKDPSDAVLKVDWDSYINTHRGVPAVEKWVKNLTAGAQIAAEVLVPAVG